MASVRLATVLAAMGNDCTIVQTPRESETSRVIAGVRVIGGPDTRTLNGAAGESAGPILVTPPLSAMSVLRSLGGAGRSHVVFWLHNNLSIDLLDEAFALGLDRVVCVSSPAAAVYDGYPWWQRVEAVPYALREDIPGEVNEPVRTRVAFIGATTEAKGFHRVLEAWPLVLDVVPEAALDVFGSISLHQPDAQTGSTAALTPEFEARYWQAFVRRTGEKLSGSVRFRGSIERADLFRHLRRTRAVIVNPNLTGSTETFCLSAVEAQACGVPVVGAAAQGLQETIADGASGILLRSQSPQELANAILRLIREDSLWSRLSAGARTHAARYRDPAVEAERWMGVAERAVSGAPAARRRSFSGVLKGATGFGRAKLALKRRLRPHQDLVAIK